MNFLFLAESDKSGKSIMTYRIKAYKRRVQYHETDRMGIMHNSNYYRWFEEARIDYMDQTKYPLKVIEEMGIFLPVAESSAEFLSPAEFAEDFYVVSEMVHFTGYKMTINFKIINANSRSVCTTGRIKYGVISKDGKPILLQRQFPEVYEDWQAVLNLPSVIDEFTDPIRI